MKKVLCAGVCLIVLLFAGCGTNELENNAFPLAVGIDLDEGDAFQVYMAYPDLQDQNAKDNAMTTDVFWNGKAADLFAGADEMSDSSNKNVDFNHLKVLIVDRKVLENEKTKEELIAFFEENKDAAWNTYVMLSDGNIREIFSDGLLIGSSLGIYLEDMLEEWTNIRQKARTTVGNLMSQYYNGNENFLAPILTVEDAKPQVRSFAALRDVNCASILTEEQAYETMLLQNQLKSFSFALDDDTRMTLHLISAKRSIAEDAGRPVVRVRIQAVARAKNRLSLSEQEKRDLMEQAERQLESRLTILAEEQQTLHGLDVTNSFLLLAGHNRGLWQIYAKNRTAYERDIRYEIQVEISQEE